MAKTSKTPGLRIAILGCGAVTELCHLPAFRRLERSPVLLVDRDVDRARQLAAGCGAAVAEHWAAHLDTFDAAIIALPHHLHANVAVELLSQGKHLLVEKPMALGGAPCEAMVSAAEASRVVLAVGQVRRFWHANCWVNAAIEAGLLGEIRSFDLREGSPYGWPAASDFFWRRESAGGGVLTDIGAHVLDLLSWWLGPLDVLSYRDDDFGGVEAEAEARLRLAGFGDGVVELSRTRELRNTVILRGSQGDVEVDLHGNRLTGSPTVLLEWRSGGLRGDRLPRQTGEDLFVAQLQDWFAAIAGGRPLAPGREAAAAPRLIEQLYARRQKLVLPWVKPDPLASEVGV